MSRQTLSSQPIRLFFGVMPDPRDAARIREFGIRHRRDRGLAGSLHRADRLHVTLMGLGDWVGPVPAAIMQAVCSVGAAIRVAPFDVTFDRAMSFTRNTGDRAYVLLGEDGVIDLRLLHRDLAGAMLKYSCRKRAFPGFTPHMTLLYDRLLLEAQQIAPVSWTARELLLIESWKGLTHYEIRGRWPLLENRQVV